MFSTNSAHHLPAKSISLSNLPLRPSTITTLSRSGFLTAQEVLECGCHEQTGRVSSLATELNVSLSIAASILREVHTVLASVTSTFLDRSKSAASILEQVLPSANSISTTAVPPLRPIVSFVQSMDAILGGGFFPREVTEIVGAPGSGKTQIAMQLCVDARLPRDFGGVSGGALYLDTEGSFSPERCWNMARALVEHVHSSARKSQSKVMAVVERDETLAVVGKRKKLTQGLKTVPPDFTPEAILDGIHVFPIHDEETQTATILSLPRYLDKYHKDNGFPVKVVVVDSIAFHYRSISSDSKSRTRSILSLVHSLSDLANKYDLAVVLINQMTTQVSSSYKGAVPSDHHHHHHSFYPHEQESDDTMVMEGDVKLIPALGASFAHSTTTRILVMQDPTESIRANTHTNEICTKIPRRVCKLIKSPHKPVALAYFYITDQGIRDWSQTHGKHS